MSLLFSQVTLTAENGDAAEFFVGGIPRNTDDFDGWTAYENFIGELDTDTAVQAHVETYLYGGGESVKATPEEIAYLMKRISFDDRFLSGHCDNTKNSDFRFSHNNTQYGGMICD